MVNFYAELGLDKTKRLDELNSDLNRLESTWKRREITNPEKATTMLALIIQARKVFATDGSRRTYDDELSNGNKTPDQVDPRKERDEEITKWKNQAHSYYETRQFDLAKVAVEKALSLFNSNDDDDALFAMAAEIYNDNGDLNSALSYINRAIVTAPEVSSYYLTKGLIYDQQASSGHRYNNRNDIDLRTEARKMFQLAVAKAEKSGDKASCGKACGALAFSYYFQNPTDKGKGEQFANLAVNYGGDSWGNADKVLKDILREKEETEKKAKEEEYQKYNPIYENAKEIEKNSMGREHKYALELALEQYMRIPEYLDSKEHIISIKSKLKELEDNEERERENRKEQAKKRRIFFIKKILPISLIACMVLGIITTFVYNRHLHKCGDNIKWSYSKDSKVLEFTGTGDMYEFNPYNFDDKPWHEKEVESVIIADGITSIGSYAFRNLKMTDIELPNSIVRIGDGAFQYSKLEHLTIPENVTEIGAAFAFCDDLKSIDVDEKNQKFISVDGVLFNHDMTTLYLYPAEKKGENYTVPDTVRDIYEYAFCDVKELKTVKFPDSLENIGGWAFFACHLTEIEIPSGLTSIPEHGFSYCDFPMVSIPGNISEIGTDAFYECKELKKVNLEEGVERINGGAFLFCEKLNDITVPSTVNYIGNQAFDYCKDGCVINYKGTQDEWVSLVGEDYDSIYTIKYTE
jgi:cell surface protein